MTSAAPRWPRGTPVCWHSYPWPTQLALVRSSLPPRTSREFLGLTLAEGAELTACLIFLFQGGGSVARQTAPSQVVQGKSRQAHAVLHATRKRPPFSATAC